MGSENVCGEVLEEGVKVRTERNGNDSEQTVCLKGAGLFTITLSCVLLTSYQYFICKTPVYIPTPLFHSTKKVLIISSLICCSQPPRSAHPVVRFSCVDCEPMVIDKLPFDKYELEPSPLTQYILERKSPHMCWQVW